MQYFEAVRIGKQRANKSQMKLFNICGFAMLTLTTKKKEGKFIPIGEQEFVTIIQTKDGFVVLIVDEEGFTKAQSKPLERTEAEDIFKNVRESDMPEFAGDHIEIWTEKYPVVRSS